MVFFVGVPCVMGNECVKARNLVAAAKRLVVLTGAGVSAESGVPTFLGREGLWRNFDPMQLATPEAFAADARNVWEWYDWRRTRMAECRPNAAHHAIVELEKKKRDGFWLVTQNVDGLHELAGSRRMARMHGSIWRVRRADGVGGEWEDRRVPLAPLPLMDGEGNLLRPAVVWYGEMLPMDEYARCEVFMGDGVDVALVVGTSALITYIQHWLLALKRAGTAIIEVNTEPTGVSRLADICLYARAGEVLPTIVGN